MSALSRSLSQGSSIVLAAALAMFLACTRNYPQSSLAPASEFAEMIDRLFKMIIWWGVGVFVVVEAVLLYIVFRYRRRAETEGRPTPVHGHTRLEIAWTVAPAVILVFIAVPTVRTIFVTQTEKAVPNALNVEVTAHQWWWEFAYPDLGIVTANELHVPAKTTVNIALTSSDVIHSFWVPRLGGKRDVHPLHKHVPGQRSPVRTSRLWFTPDSVGIFTGQCAEFCGISHAHMGFRVISETPDAFRAWLENERRPAVGSPGTGGAAPGREGAAGPVGAGPAGEQSPQQRPAGATTARDVAPGEAVQDAAAQPDAAFGSERVQEAPASAAPTEGDTTAEGTQEAERSPAATPQDSVARTFAAIGDAARGAQLFQRSACLACHTIRGTNARGRIGPDLTHVGGRQMIAAELLKNTPENMARWLRDPPAVKPGAKMPNLNLKEDQVADLVAYLHSLK